MKKEVFRVSISDTHDRWTVFYKSPPFTPEHMLTEGLAYQIEILQTLSNFQNSHCGGKPFEKLQMYYDGLRWIAELEAVVPKQSS